MVMQAHQPDPHCTCPMCSRRREADRLLFEHGVPLIWGYGMLSEDIERLAWRGHLDDAKDLGDLWSRLAELETPCPAPPSTDASAARSSRT